MTDFSPNDWICTYYQENYYFGQILSLDAEEVEVLVDFLKEPGNNKKKSFTKENRSCYVPLGWILRKVPDPTFNKRKITWASEVLEDCGKRFADFDLPVE